MKIIHFRDFEENKGTTLLYNHFGKIMFIFIWQQILAAAAVQKTFCAMFLSPGHEGLFGQIKRRFNTTVVKNPISLLNLKRHQRP